MKTKNVIKGILIFSAGVLLIVFRAEAADGIKQGVRMCLEVLVPSLFPFMILSYMAVRLLISDEREGGIAIVFRKITGLPFSALTVIIFGFLGGYPVGLNMIAELFEKEIIDRKHVLRLASFCVNAGPAFIITAVGTMIFGSSNVGYMLFFCVCTSSLITGLLTSFFIKTERNNVAREMPEQKFSDVFVSSVESSCKNMFIMCGWVLMFSCFSGIIGASASTFLKNIWSVFGEVTAGVYAAEKIGGLPLTAACISSGGLCVMCQLLPAMKKCGVRIREYLTFRTVNSFVSYVVMNSVLKIFPITAETFSVSDIKLSSGCAPASIVLLITSVVFIVDISSGRINKLSIKDLF